LASGGVEGVTVLSRWDNVEPSSPTTTETYTMDSTDKIVAAILAGSMNTGKALSYDQCT